MVHRHGSVSPGTEVDLCVRDPHLPDRLIDALEHERLERGGLHLTPQLFVHLVLEIELALQSLGGVGDPAARIWPFKMMRGKQPYDAELNTPLFVSQR